MARKVRFIVLGDSILKEKLKGLTDSEAKNVIQRACRDAMKVVQKAAKAAAPKKTGALRRSIRVRAIKRSRVRIGARVTTSASDNMYTGKTFYGAFQEYGWTWKPRKKTASDFVGPRRKGYRARPKAAEFVGPRRTNRGREYLKGAIDSTRTKAYEIFNAQIDDHLQKVFAKRKTKGVQK